jgi:SSS family solute:Na+ symporter
VAVYLAGITLYGLRFRKRQRTLRDYFLADRNIPWWAIALSIVAAETSTLTIISIPGLAYDTNLAFLQVVFGYLVARVILSILFIPRYFQGNYVTAYEYLQQRFGGTMRSATATLFLLTRAAAEGVRVYAISIVVGIALGIHDIAAIAVITGLTMLYTYEGGMAAVIWTDVAQMAIYVSGTLAGAFVLLHLTPGGWTAIHATATATGKLQVLDFSTSLFTTYTFWSGMIGGTFLTCASHGTDQLMVQRLLAARNQRQSQIALSTSGIIILMQFTLFLLVGTMLYAYYRQFPPGVAFASSDRIFPIFIVQHMPQGMAGLLIAAILAAAMSNLSAALNSLSASSIVDFHQRLKPQATDTERVRYSRVATLLWAVALFGLALLSRYGGRVVEQGLKIASLAYGAMLGVFLLGVLTRNVKQSGALVGMLCGLGVNLYLWGWTSIAWTWYVAMGSTMTFVVGYLANLFFERELGGEKNG